MTEEHNPEPSHSVKNFAKEALHDLLHFDQKIFRSIRDLLLKPGLLTASAIEGNSQKYMKPLGLFIFVNFMFFVLKDQGVFQYNLSAYTTYPFFKEFVSHHIQDGKLSYEVFEAEFNTAMRFEQKGFLILLVPLIALGMKFIYRNKRTNYVEHLVFAFHFLSFFLLFLLLVPVVYLILFSVVKIIGQHLPDNDITLLSVVIPAMLLWVAIAAKKCYNESWFVTIIKATGIVALLLGLIAAVYRNILFFIVMHAIHQ